jgi:hypothetical protein
VSLTLQCDLPLGLARPAGAAPGPAVLSWWQKFFALSQSRFKESAIKRGREETEAVIEEVKARYRDAFTAITVLWKGRLY